MPYKGTGRLGREKWSLYSIYQFLKFTGPNSLGLPQKSSQQGWCSCSNCQVKDWPKSLLTTMPPMPENKDTLDIDYSRLFWRVDGLPLESEENIEITSCNSLIFWLRPKKINALPEFHHYYERTKIRTPGSSFHRINSH